MTCYYVPEDLQVILEAMDAQKRAKYRRENGLVVGFPTGRAERTLTTNTTPLLKHVYLKCIPSIHDNLCTKSVTVESKG